MKHLHFLFRERGTQLKFDVQFCNDMIQFRRSENRQRQACFSARHSQPEPVFIFRSERVVWRTQPGWKVTGSGLGRSRIYVHASAPLGTSVIYLPNASRAKCHSERFQLTMPVNSICRSQHVEGSKKRSGYSGMPCCHNLVTYPIPNHNLYI